MPRDDQITRQRYFFRRPKISNCLTLLLHSNVPAKVWRNPRINAESRSKVQLNHVRNLLISVKSLNCRYVARWAKELSVASLYREVSE